MRWNIQQHCQRVTIEARFENLLKMAEYLFFIWLNICNSKPLQGLSEEFLILTKLSIYIRPFITQDTILTRV